MASTLDGMSPKELEALIAEANSRMASVKSDHIARMRAQIESQLAAEDLTVDEVFPARTRKVGKRAGAGIAKYRNPENAQQTWTGFGKKPRWFVEAIAKPGVTADSLLIDKRSAAATKAPAKAASKPASKTAAKKPAANKPSARKAAGKKAVK